LGLVRPQDAQPLAGKKPEDTQSFLETWMGSGDARAKSLAFQVLLYNWVERLGLEKGADQKVPPDTVARLYKINDVLYGAGTAHLLEHVLRTGGDEAVDTFFKELPNQYLGPRSGDHDFVGNKVLLAAVEADANAAVPLQRVVHLLESLEARPGVAQAAPAQLEKPLKEAMV